MSIGFTAGRLYTITFGDRSHILTCFPPNGEQITIRKTEFPTEVVIGDEVCSLTFSENAHDNGWWLKSSQGDCQVTVQDSTGKFL